MTREQAALVAEALRLLGRGVGESLGLLARAVELGHDRDRGRNEQDEEARKDAEAEATLKRIGAL